MRPAHRPLVLCFSLLLIAAGVSSAQPSEVVRQKVIIDTDIGDDIDDAYAIGLALHSPELDVLGVTTAWGDTALRSRLVLRLLAVAGRGDIPVHAGVTTPSKTDFTQRAWALAGPPPAQHDAPDFLLDQIRSHPHQVTLIAIGPLTNLAAAIDRDPATFRLLRRVVLMGGSIHRGYGDPAAPPTPPAAEYNIAMDSNAARKLLQSGVPIFMMPLDSTQLKLDDVRLGAVAAKSTPLTDALLVLTAEWQHATRQSVPTLYDVMAVAYAIQPQLCPATRLHVMVDPAGFTRVIGGAPNTEVCLSSNSDDFFGLLLPRLEHFHFPC